MANILLTTRCNRSCPYCFARQEMAGAAASVFLSWENLIYVADFLKAAGERHVSLLGGEPTGKNTGASLVTVTVPQLSATTGLPSTTFVVPH